MIDKFRLHRTGTQLIDSLVHGAPNDYEYNVPAITVRPECRWNDRPAATSSALPKLDILAVDADETQLEEWEAEDDVKGGPLAPREVKAARQKEIQYLWDMEVYEYSTEAEARARTGRNPVGLKCTKAAPKPHVTARVWCVRKCATKGVEPNFSATPPLETLRVPLCVACQEDVFRVEDPFLISIADVSRAHFYADAVRVVYVRRTPRQNSQACVGNCERQCTHPWM